MRLNPRVTRVVPEADHRLRLTFSNGEVRVFDVGPLLDKGVFRELRNEAMFKSVHPWHGTVQWSGGQDICPDTLYEDSVPVSESGSSKESVVKARMSFSLFNQNTDWKEGAVRKSASEKAPHPALSPWEREKVFRARSICFRARPLPGGEGRVRGLFLDVARRLNNKAKLVPEKCGDFGRSKCRKSRRIIHSAIHLSRNPPTNSFEEA